MVTIKQKTHEEYVAQVATINPNIEVVGIYAGSMKKILHRCRIDHYEWCAIPNSVLQGSGCPQCSKQKQIKRQTKTHGQYVLEVIKLNPNIEVIDNYLGSEVPILHKCKIDECEWLAKPSNILSGKGCPECAGNKKRGHEEYVEMVAEIDDNIEVVETYINANTPILHRCKIDNYEWYITPNHILRGTGCPKCNESKGEKIITDWLNKNNILYEPQKRFDDCRHKKPLPFDFYLPNYNVCIEYNGIQHYKPIDYFGGEEALTGVIMRDKIKEDYCNNNNIRLIKIAYNTNIYEELQKLYNLFVMNEVA